MECVRLEIEITTELLKIAETQGTISRSNLKAQFKKLALNFSSVVFV